MSSSRRLMRRCVLATALLSASAARAQVEFDGPNAAASQALSDLREKTLADRAEAASPRLPTIDEAIPPAVREHLLADLRFVAGIRGTGATPLHRAVFGPVDGRAYLAFFTERIHSIELGDCGAAYACAERGGHRMWITPAYVGDDDPQMFRIMVMFHEARHAEKNHDGWPHADCPTPYKNAAGADVTSSFGTVLAGQLACDTEKLGSYGASLVMLENIAKYCGNCGQKTRDDAEFFAQDQLSTRIIDPAAKQELEDDLR